MPGLLAVEAGDQFASVALAFGNNILWESTFFLPQVQSAVLAPMVQKLMESAAASWENVDAMVVGKGPGSYTGLRIATSLAKGICFSQNLPLISICSLENMAMQAFENQPDVDLAVVSIDARRDEVYLAVFNRNLGHLIPPSALKMADLDLKLVLKENKTVFVGTGAEKLVSFNQPERTWKSLPDIFPKARYHARKAVELFKNQHFEDLAKFEPEYLKPVFLTETRK